MYLFLGETVTRNYLLVSNTGFRNRDFRASTTWMLKELRELKSK